jgi:hexosaminidase
MLFLALLMVQAPSASPALMPQPASIEWGAGKVRLDSSFSIRIAKFSDSRLERAIGRTLTRLEGRIGQPLARRTATAAAATVTLAVSGAGLVVQTPEEDESYRFESTPAGITITAPSVVGALRGLATLEQLVSADAAGYYIPATVITDRPRFPWRGLLLDAGRHFMPPEVIRRTLDGMALVKLNVLHWHLSDDQGFRVESRRYPRLHGLGSDSLYYTQEEIRALVAYARDRGIRIVPEFDMPGHTTSWFVGYPEHASAPGPYAIERRFGIFDPAFNPTREETYQFIEGFVEEMVQLFPDPFWHIGGDEVTGKHWNQNPRILRFKRTRRMADNEALHAYFNGRLSRILTKHHRRMVGWDEILHPDLPAGSVVQSWRGTEYLGRAAAQGMGAILSAPYYLDHMKTTDEYYLTDPLPSGHGMTPEQAARVLGAEACMWAEHVDATTVDSRIWPRMAALAERFWSPASVRDVDDMYRRLSLVSIQLEREGLTHEAHTYRMLRLLAGQRGVQPLHDLLAATMPATFSQRSRLQGTTQLTPLTRLVDAARPDPWVRSRMLRLAAEVAGNPREPSPAREELARTLASWTPLAARIAALSDSLPLARDGEPAARALGRLAEVGITALGHLRDGQPPTEWKEMARTTLDELANPHGLLRLAGVEAVRLLIEGVPPAVPPSGGR